MTTRELDEKEIREQLDAAGWDLKTFPLYFHFIPDQRQIDLTIKYKSQLYDFREFMKIVCAEDIDEDDYSIWDETCFSSLSTGFFIAKGLSVEEACALSSFTRYGLQDFENDPDVNPKAPK